MGGVVPLEHAALLLSVLGDIDQDRAGAPGARDIKRLADGAGDLLGLGDEVVMLRDGEGDAGDVGLLERIGPDQMARDLTRDRDHRDAVQHRGRQAGDEIRRAWAGGRDAHTDLVLRAGVSIGHMRGALLVARQHVVDGVLNHRVVRGHDRAAGVPEDDLYALPNQGLPDDLGARERRAGAVGELCVSHARPGEGVGGREGDGG